MKTVMMGLDDIETKIAGIPCVVTCVYFHEQKPQGPMVDSDQDANGYVDIEFCVMDRRGRPASWLEDKMTDADIARIKRLIINSRK